VVIDYDHVDPALLRRDDARVIARSAVARDDQLRAGLVRAGKPPARRSRSRPRSGSRRARNVGAEHAEMPPVIAALVVPSTS
jgi:hypothetical protein